MTKAENNPSQVTAVAGNVRAQFASGAELIFTPVEALEAGHRLIEAAALAQGQVKLSR